MLLNRFLYFNFVFLSFAPFTIRFLFSLLPSLFWSHIGLLNYRDGEISSISIRNPKQLYYEES